LAILDRYNAAPIPLIEACRIMMEGGIRFIQIREKEMPAMELFSIMEKIVQLGHLNRCLVVVNGRADVASSSHSDGVHLPQNGLPIANAREILGQGKWIGKSCHTLDEAKEAEKEGADYIVFSPVFPSLSKQARGPVAGLEGLKTVSHAVRIPVFALSGITPEKISDCLRQGAYGVAVFSGFFSEGTLEEKVAEYLFELQLAL
jgi:thiamine-phosphate pyrophosphorylase